MRKILYFSIALFGILTVTNAYAAPIIRTRYVILATDQNVSGLKGKETCAYIQIEIKKGNGSFKKSGKPFWGAARLKQNGEPKFASGTAAEKLAGRCLKAKGRKVPVIINAKLLAPGKIIFAAHNSQDSDAELGLYIVGVDGMGLARIANIGGFGAPDIESKLLGGWKIASGEETIAIFDTQSLAVTTIDGVKGATRADFDSGAQTVTFQGGDDGAGAGINIYKVSSTGTDLTQLTNVPFGINAEWPYFSPAGDGILYFQSLQNSPPKQFMGIDGSNNTTVEAPGGNTVSHASFHPDGSEFLDSQSLTSYRVDTGAQGQLNDLKTTTTMMAQLASMGFEEVPSSDVPGQANRGTFALSADWSRDGNKIVFDALVRDSQTDQITGVAIFVYAIGEDSLKLVFGPEPFNGERTNNYNYSTYTPKWVP